MIYGAFIEDELYAPMHLARTVDRVYCEPNHPEFAPARSGACKTPSRRRSSFSIPCLSSVNCELRLVIRQHPMTSFSVHSKPYLLSVNAELIRLEKCVRKIHPTIGF